MVSLIHLSVVFCELYLIAKGIANLKISKYELSSNFHPVDQPQGYR